MNDKNFRILYLKVFYFCKILKMRKKIIRNPQTFLFVLYCTKRRCSQIKSQLKVEIEDEHEAPYKLNMLNVRTDGIILQNVGE